MALKAILEKLEDAPEAVRDQYRAGTKEEGAEGKFVLSVEGVGGFALENVDGLKSALSKERTAVGSLTKTLEKFKDIDPDKAREALGKVDELSKIDPEKEADKIVSTRLDALKGQLVEKHNNELASRDQRINALTGTVDDLVRRQQATAAIAEAKGSIELLLPHVLAQSRSVEKDGKWSVEVIDKDGNARIGDSAGAPMSLSGLVAEMRKSETFSRAFDGDGHSGSGAQHDNGGGDNKSAPPGAGRSERGAHYAKKFNLPVA
jgi:hypothetical protein